MQNFWSKSHWDFPFVISPPWSWEEHDTDPPPVFQGDFPNSFNSKEKCLNVWEEVQLSWWWLKYNRNVDKYKNVIDLWSYTCFVFWYVYEIIKIMSLMYFLIFGILQNLTPKMLEIAFLRDSRFQNHAPHYIAGLTPKSYAFGVRLGPPKMNVASICKSLHFSCDMRSAPETR